MIKIRYILKTITNNQEVVNFDKELNAVLDIVNDEKRITFNEDIYTLTNLIIKDNDIIVKRKNKQFLTVMNFIVLSRSNFIYKFPSGDLQVPVYCNKIKANDNHYEISYLIDGEDNTIHTIDLFIFE